MTPTVQSIENAVRPRGRRLFLRDLLALGGLAAAPGLLAACGGDAPKPTTEGQPGEAVKEKWPRLSSREVVVAGFGGQTYEIRRKVIFTPFTDLAGARVVDAPWDYGKFVSMVDAAKPEWDMIDFDGYSLVGLVQSGKAPAKLADWVRRCDGVDKEFQDYAGGNYTYSVALGWSTDLETAPANWVDFFDTAKFPGKRAFPKSIYAGRVELALIADGVSKDKIYPLDFDRAFAKLDTIKKDLIFYDSYAQGQVYMTQGSASMIATANSRLIQLKDGGEKVDYTYDDAVLYPWGAFAMPQNLPHADAANALIDYMSTPEIQAEVAKQLFLGPVVPAAFDKLDEEAAAKQPNSPENKEKALTVNTKVAAEQDAEYVERFFAWVGE